MAHSYKAEYPRDSSVDPGIVQFFEDFYRISDDPTANDDYVGQFTDDATFVMASKRAVGKEEITATRLGMWTAVASRRHTVYQIYPFGGGSDQFMLHGVVTLGLRTGATVDVEWAGRAEMARPSGDGKWRMKRYQVYLDTGAMKK